MNNPRYGIFISYKRSHVHLAGRIYDFFRTKGIDPFMDMYSLSQRKNYKEDIRAAIDASPYFLCLLTEDGYNDLKNEDEYLDSDQMTYAQEVNYAIQNNKEIRILSYGNVTPRDLESLPERFRSLADIDVNRSKIDDVSFLRTMNDFFEENIDIDKLTGIIDWHEYISMNSNTLLMRRKDLHAKYATMENRFGKEFMHCVDTNTPFTGEYMIEEINMTCYAASLQFAPQRDMVDRKAFDNGRMFNTFSRLLEDPDFSMCIVTTMPDCPAVQDTIKYNKLGNSALKRNPEAVFYGSFGKVNALCKQEPYRSALKETRFQFMMTECAMPYALFQVLYKEPWQQFNHIKVDLYSYKLDSSTSRRSMCFFENDPDDRGNYEFFNKQIEDLKDYSVLVDHIPEERRKAWLDKWEQIRPSNEE
ncbi:MAG: toll/interleukin-1 receptor domain-containing protein [Lachnospiraceae bacterium]|nr:toll/interleukin-1 receptor domain-containing protein [Lachnospiraceae bacterium]